MIRDRTLRSLVVVGLVLLDAILALVLIGWLIMGVGMSGGAMSRFRDAHVADGRHGRGGSRRAGRRDQRLAGVGLVEETGQETADLVGVLGRVEVRGGRRVIDLLPLVVRSALLVALDEDRDTLLLGKNAFVPVPSTH
jgi:hypothetical protein